MLMLAFLLRFKSNYLEGVKLESTERAFFFFFIKAQIVLIIVYESSLSFYLFFYAFA